MALRFERAVGVSPGQCTDLMIPALFKSACIAGILKVNHAETARMFAQLIENFHEDTEGGIQVFNLGSFTT